MFLLNSELNLEMNTYTLRLNTGLMNLRKILGKNAHFLTTKELFEKLKHSLFQFNCF